jgi:hypothetical protein
VVASTLLCGDENNESSLHRARETDSHPHPHASGLPHHLVHRGVSTHRKHHHPRISDNDSEAVNRNTWLHAKLGLALGPCCAPLQDHGNVNDDYPDSLDSAHAFCTFQRNF